MITITKKFGFEAAHQLPEKECYGHCRNLHGHSYKLYVEVSLQTESGIDVNGWVCNFSEISDVVDKYIIDICDHQFLNDVLPIPITTAENIVLWIKNELEKHFPTNIQVESLSLYETAKCKATWKR